MDNKYEANPNNAQRERRQFKRISRNYVVSYAPVIDDKLIFDISQTKNLSEGGLSLITDKKFDKDVILKIKLRLPEFSDYVIVLAQVVDSVGRVKGGMCETRAKFVKVEQKIIEAIRRLVDHG